MTELNPCWTSHVTWVGSKLYTKLLWIPLHPKVYALKRRCGTTLSHLLHWANKLQKVWQIRILYPDWWVRESAHPESWPYSTHECFNIAPMLYQWGTIQRHQDLSIWHINAANLARTFRKRLHCVGFTCNSTSPSRLWTSKIPIQITKNSPGITPHLMECHQWDLPITSRQNQRPVGGTLQSPPERNIQIHKWWNKWIHKYKYLYVNIILRNIYIYTYIS